MNKSKIIIIGACGYWGQKIIKTIEQIGTVEIIGLCDTNISGLNQYKSKYPCYGSLENIPTKTYDTGLIITRAGTHFELAKKLLKLNKNVFVEKPMTLNLKDAKSLTKLVKEKQKVLSVDHTFVFASEINYLKNYFLLNKKAIKLLESKRVNKGPFSKDLNVLQDLACHDFSILNYIVPHQIKGISAVGSSIINGVIEKALITVFYKNTSFKAFIEVSWLERDKLRMIRMIDLHGQEIRYDSNNGDNLTLTGFTNGKNQIIKLDNSEQPLLKELKYFINCAENNKQINLIDGEEGYKVIKMIEMANTSIKRNGEMIEI